MMRTLSVSPRKHLEQIASKLAVKKDEQSNTYYSVQPNQKDDPSQEVPFNVGRSSNRLIDTEGALRYDMTARQLSDGTQFTNMRSNEILLLQASYELKTK